MPLHTFSKELSPEMNDLLAPDDLQKKCEAVDRIIASIRGILKQPVSSDVDSIIVPSHGRPSPFLPLNRNGYEEALKMALRIRAGFVSFL